MVILADTDLGCLLDVDERARLAGVPVEERHLAGQPPGQQEAS
jgi:hypothetical protein